MRILLTIFALFFSIAHAEPDLTGSYIGCGKSVAFYNNTVIFHLLKIPTGFGPKDFQYTASFSWKGISETYFSEIAFDETNTKMLMRINITPRRDYGLIIKTLTVESLPDGSLVGAYHSNSIVHPGLLAIGTWTAKKFNPEAGIPAISCR